MSLCSLSTAEFLRSLYLKVWEILGNAKKYIVTKVKGYILARLVEMQRSEPILGKLKEPVYIKAGEESILFVLAKVPFSVPINLANDISVDANIDYRVDLRLTVHLPIIGNISLPLPCQQDEAKISELFSNLMDQNLDELVIHALERKTIKHFPKSMFGANELLRKTDF